MWRNSREKYTQKKVIILQLLVAAVSSQGSIVVSELISSEGLQYVVCLSKRQRLIHCHYVQTDCVPDFGSAGACHCCCCGTYYRSIKNVHASTQLVIILSGVWLHLGLELSVLKHKGYCKYTITFSNVKISYYILSLILLCFCSTKALWSIQGFRGLIDNYLMSMVMILCLLPGTCALHVLRTELTMQDRT